MTSIRASIYTRISADDGTGLGVERQERDCRDLAARLGWDVEGVYCDNDVSATRSKVRPAYQRMLQAVEAGRSTGIIVWDVDRLTRTPRELEDVIDFADRHGLRLASVGGEIDLSTEQGRLTARMKGSVARYEVEQSSRRLKRKHDELAAAGRPSGKPAYGYTRTRVDGVPTDVVNPAEAAVIRECTQRVLAGEGLWRIVKDLNRRGVTTNTGGPWATQTMRRMLLRPRNAGLRTHRGQIVGPAAWEPIIDRATYDRLVAKLTDPKRRTSNRGTEVRYLLSNLARCGVCGGRVVGTAEFVYSYRTFPHRYACNHAGCHKVSRRMAPVDEVVEGVIVGLLERDGLRLLGGDPSAAETARRRIEAVEARLALAADQFADGAITAEQLTRITARLRPEADRERGLLARYQPSPELARFATSPAAAWAAASVETRRAIVDMLAEVTIQPQGPGREFDPALIEFTWRWS